MPKIEIPQFAMEDFYSVEQSVKFNGYSKKSDIEVNIGDNKHSLYWMKGNIGQGLFCVLCDPKTMEWYKVAGSTGMISKIEHEFYGMLCSLNLNNLETLTKEIKLVKPSINGISLPAVHSPHLGTTIEYLNKNKKEEKMSFYLFSVYEVALLHAKEMLNNFGIWIDDPNSGNIILHKCSDNEVNVLFIDFTSSHFRAESTQKNENILHDRFQKHAEKLLPFSNRRNL